MKSAIRLLLFAVCAVLAVLWWQNTDGPRRFTKAARHADKLLLYEGLPHQLFERHLLEEERRTKLVQQLRGYLFYQEPLELKVDDAKRLTEVLADRATFEFVWPVLGLKWCGGFHPDYALEWRHGSNRYHALVCFGCTEAKLFGPWIDSHNDLEPDAYARLKAILPAYRKNRPPRKAPEYLPIAPNEGMHPTAQKPGGG